MIFDDDKSLNMKDSQRPYISHSHHTIHPTVSHVVSHIASHILSHIVSHVVSHVVSHALSYVASHLTPHIPLYPTAWDYSFKQLEIRKNCGSWTSTC